MPFSIRAACRSSPAASNRKIALRGVNTELSGAVRHFGRSACRIFRQCRAAAALVGRSAARSMRPMQANLADTHNVAHPKRITFVARDGKGHAGRLARAASWRTATRVAAIFLGRQLLDDECAAPASATREASRPGATAVPLLMTGAPRRSSSGPALGHAAAHRSPAGAPAARPCGYCASVPPSASTTLATSAAPLRSSAACIAGSG
jgi:hypothetical protein